MSEVKDTDIVIFGASGDLTSRKLIPSLYNLYRKERLPEGTTITGFAFDDFTHESFRSKMQEAVKQFEPEEYSDELWDGFSKKLFYITGDFSRQEDFEALKTHLENLEERSANQLFYLSTAPRFFELIAEQLGSLGMTKSTEGWRHMVVEKPFGKDLESARALNNKLHEFFNEKQLLSH